MSYSEKKNKKTEDLSNFSGGMYRGANVPVGVLDVVILGGIALMTALIFFAAA